MAAIPPGPVPVPPAPPALTVLHGMIACGLSNVVQANVGSSPVLWLSWVDDLMVCGQQGVVMKGKSMMNQLFDCDDEGPMKEYVGCKIERSYKPAKMKLTQPVMIQSFEDEFDLSVTGKPRTPAIAGDVLVKDGEAAELDTHVQKEYRKGVGKLLHMCRWSRPDIVNSVRELSRYMTGAVMSHLERLYRTMSYCAATPMRGAVIEPNETWDGNPNYLFKVRGRADSDYAKDLDSRKSASGWITYLCGAIITCKSKLMPITALSVTEAELFAAVMCVQDMMFIMRVLESLGLKVEKPMVLEIDNKGAIDLVNNWSVGGRTRHIDVKNWFLRDLKEEGILRVEYINTNDNTSDINTKNLSGPVFETHTMNIVGPDGYYVHPYN